MKPTKTEETRMVRLARLLKESEAALEVKNEIIKDMNRQLCKERDESEYIEDQITRLEEQIKEALG